MSNLGDKIDDWKRKMESYNSEVKKVKDIDKKIDVYSEKQSNGQTLSDNEIKEVDDLCKERNAAIKKIKDYFGNDDNVIIS